MPVKNFHNNYPFHIFSSSTELLPQCECDDGPDFFHVSSDFVNILVKITLDMLCIYLNYVLRRPGNGRQICNWVINTIFELLYCLRIKYVATLSRFMNWIRRNLSIFSSKNKLKKIAKTLILYFSFHVSTPFFKNSNVFNY